MHPTLTRYAVRNCNQPLDYIKPRVRIPDFFIGLIVVPLLWLACILMGDPRE